MITDVGFDTSPFAPGEQRWIRVWATTPVTIDIKCFTRRPPPPGYKRCPECGTIRVPSGQPVIVGANDQLFARNTGYLEVTISDDTGDARVIRVDVDSNSTTNEPQSLA